MAYEKKEGDVSVFKNSRRTDENNAPHYTGQALYNGETLDISLWLKFPEGKEAFLSGKVQKHVPRDRSGEDPIQSAHPALAVEEAPADIHNPLSAQPEDDLPF